MPGTFSLTHAGFKQQSKGPTAPDESTAAETPEQGSPTVCNWTFVVRFSRGVSSSGAAMPKLAHPGDLWMIG